MGPDFFETFCRCFSALDCLRIRPVLLRILPHNYQVLYISLAHQLLIRSKTSVIFVPNRCLRSLFFQKSNLLLQICWNFPSVSVIIYLCCDLYSFGRRACSLDRRFQNLHVCNRFFRERIYTPTYQIIHHITVFYIGSNYSVSAIFIFSISCVESIH